MQYRAPAPLWAKRTIHRKCAGVGLVGVGPKGTMLPDCGVEFTTESPNKTRCDPCQRIRSLELMRRAARKAKLKRFKTDLNVSKFQNGRSK